MRLTVFLTASIMGVTIAVKTDFAGLNEAGAMEDTQNACQEDEIMKKRILPAGDKAGSNKT